jgi:hypothetical protein
MRGVLRRLAATVVLLSAGWSLAACGGGGQAASATVARGAATTPTTSGAHVFGAIAKALTKRQALVFARAVNLTAADVPGFKASSKHEHEHETPAEKRLEGELTRCAGAPSSKDQLAEASSEEFGREDQSAVQSVRSSVSVVRTAALAATELAAIRSARGRACLSRYVDLLFKSQKYSGASVGPVSIAPGSPSAPGTTGGFAWRIQTAITFRGVRIPFFMDIAGFVYGPAEVTLFSFGMPAPPPAALEERLFALLVQRAKAHSL